MKLLLLAGTSDARRIADDLVGLDGLEVTASLAGVTRRPLPFPCPVRIGGFGGEDGFKAYLKSNKIDAVVDATHPFAVQMSRTAAAVCQGCTIPHIQMLRGGWSPSAGDNWTSVPNEAAVAAHVPEGATVFLATGRQTLDAFHNLQNRKLICRQIDPSDRPFPFANGIFLIGRPPFSVEQEKTLFRDLGVDWLVVKNSGAEASRTKLDAARALGIKVAMIDRPKQPDCIRVRRVAEAVAWVKSQMNAA